MTDGRSIGQVIELLQPEFPDVTISKIRFLETKGLIAPERAASGYRRFSEADIERLRWILTQQRDRFLPLRVIRQLLDTGAWRTGESTVAGGSVGAHGDPTAAATPSAGSTPDEAVDTTDTVVGDKMGDPLSNPLIRMARPRRLRRRELLDESGLDNDQLRSLEQLGLLEATADAEGRVHFDADALVVARLAGRFLHHGVEPRHLRSYKVSAEREAALFEQRLLGQLGRSGDDATGTLAELVALGTELRAVLLRAALRDHLGDHGVEPGN